MLCALTAIAVYAYLIVQQTLQLPVFTATMRNGRGSSSSPEAEMAGLVTPLELFRMHVGRYPTTAEGLDALYTVPADEAGRGRWAGPYLHQQSLQDTWGNKLHYECVLQDGQSVGYRYWSDGPNRINEAGAGDDVLHVSVDREAAEKR